MSDGDNVLYEIIYRMIKSGGGSTRLTRGLGLFYRAGADGEENRLTISRKGVQPSGKELEIVRNTLRKTLKASHFLPDFPEVKSSELLRFGGRNGSSYGYRLTWK